MSPLGNVTSSAPDRNGKGSNQKRMRQASLFISLLILSGSRIDIQSWREAVLKVQECAGCGSNGRAIPGMQRRKRGRRGQPRRAISSRRCRVWRPAGYRRRSMSALPNRRCCRSRRAWLSNRWPRHLRRAHDRESRRESDLDDGTAVIWFIALADGSRRFLPGNSVASTGNSNWFERQLATKKSRSPRHRVRRLREPSFPAPFDRISDPQIPLTRHNFSHVWGDDSPHGDSS